MNLGKRFRILTKAKGESGEFGGSLEICDVRIMET